MSVLDHPLFKSGKSQRRYVKREEVPNYTWVDQSPGKPFYSIAKATGDGHILNVMVSGMASAAGRYPDRAELQRSVKEIIAPSLSDAP